MSGIAPKQNVFKFKIAPHKQISMEKNIWQEDGPPCPMGLCAHLSTMVNLALAPARYLEC
jgi:hypothetical protein